MTLDDAVKHVRQNIAEKLSGDTVLTQQAFIENVINLYILSDIVTLHDWTWKYTYVDQVVASGAAIFTPTGLPAGTVLDDLYCIVFKTGNQSTTKKIWGRNLSKFLEDYPDPTVRTSGRADWFTYIGSPGGPKQEIWLDRPTDAEYTLRMFLLQTFAVVTAQQELPIRSDKHMLVVAGATSWAFASLEQLHPVTEAGGDSPAAWWLRLYMDGLERWWQQDQSRSHVVTALGRYKPGGGRGLDPGAYWNNPFVYGVQDTGE